MTRLTTTTAPTAGADLRVEPSVITDGAYLGVKRSAVDLHFTADETRAVIAALEATLPTDPEPTPVLASGTVTVNLALDTTEFDKALTAALERFEAIRYGAFPQRVMVGLPAPGDDALEALKAIAKEVVVETPAPRFEVGDLVRLLSIPGVAVVEAVLEGATLSDYVVRRLTRRGTTRAVGNRINVRESEVAPVEPLKALPAVGDLVVAVCDFGSRGKGDVLTVTSLSEWSSALTYVRVEGEVDGFSRRNYAAA